MPSKVSIDPKSFKAKILFTSRQRVDSIFRSVSTGLTTLIREIVKEELYNSPEVESLLLNQFGSLKAQLGLTDDLAIEAVDDIVNLSVNTITLATVSSPADVNLIASLVIKLDGISVESYLALPSAKYISERSGSTIEWLEWLLVRGTEIIITDWHIAPGEGNPYRSDAIMIKRGTFRLEGYTGTKDDNFITRAIDRAKIPILTLVKAKLNNAL